VKVRDVKEYFIFIIGGGVGALVNWVVSFILTSLLGIYYLFSYLIAQSINIVVNFMWHRYVTFRMINSSKEKQFVRFVMLSIATIILSIGLVYLLKEYVLDSKFKIVAWDYNINYLLAIVSVTFMVSFINFIVSKVYIFTEDFYKKL